MNNKLVCFLNRCKKFISNHDAEFTIGALVVVILLVLVCVVGLLVSSGSSSNEVVESSHTLETITSESTVTETSTSESTCTSNITHTTSTETTTTMVETSSTKEVVVTFQEVVKTEPIIIETEQIVYTTDATTLIETTTETIVVDNSNVSTETSEQTDTETVLVSYGGLPVDCSFKSYMSYTLFGRSTPQYRLQQECYTDSQGIRRHGNDVCVALGSYYSTTIGDRFRITLDSGVSFTAVLADGKADRHTNSTNQYNVRPNGNGVAVEFLVDTSALDSSVRRSGNIGTYSNYSGDIVNIEKLG